MHTLYITGQHGTLTSVEAVKRLTAISSEMAVERAIENVQIATHRDAFSILHVLKTDGLACLCVSENESVLIDYRDRLKAAGFAAQVDPDVERLTRQHKSNQMTSEGATPEEVFAKQSPGQPAEAPTRVAVGPRDPVNAKGYQAALALMAAQNGNPVGAAATACNLLRATGDRDTYQGVVDALLLVFPWIEAPLIANDLIQDGPA